MQLHVSKLLDCLASLKQNSTFWMRENQCILLLQPAVV